MIRNALIALMLLAPAAKAQDVPDPVAVAADPEWPPFDAKILEVCLGTRQGLEREACIGIAAGRCMESEGGYSTVGMSYCLGQELDLWDARLNAAYGDVMAEAKRTDAEMAGLGSAAEQQEPLLQEMQRKWIGFRDAACGYERSRWGGGTGGGPASVNCSLTLTARQALWLEGYRSDEAQ